jgi:hypothetical protein
VVAVVRPGRPHWPLSSWVELLDDESRRLDELPDVRASLSVSVRQLTESGNDTDRAAADLFHRLGTLAERHVTPEVAADLTGWPVPAATAALEHLVDAKLLYSPGPGRYAFYGLVDLLPKNQVLETSRTERTANSLSVRYDSVFVRYYSA